MNKPITRRGFLSALLVAALLPVAADARTRRHRTPRHARKRGGCGSRGGPGYRNANGKCASWHE